MDSRHDRVPPEWVPVGTGPSYVRFLPGLLREGRVESLPAQAPEPSTLVDDVTISREDDLTVTGALEGLEGWIVSEAGGRYWIRTSDLCDVNAAL